MFRHVLALTSLTWILSFSLPLFAQTLPPDTQTMDKAIDDNVGPHEQFKSMMTTLQKDVREHNAAGVAELIHYPLRSSIGSIQTRAQFLKSYDRIVTPPIARVIENQKYEQLFTSSNGAMFGDGEVWIAGICEQKDCKGKVDIRVITIQSTANLHK